MWCWLFSTLQYVSTGDALTGDELKWQLLWHVLSRTSTHHMRCSFLLTSKYVSTVALTIIQNGNSGGMRLTYKRLPHVLLTVHVKDCKCYRTNRMIQSGHFLSRRYTTTRFDSSSLKGCKYCCIQCMTIIVRSYPYIQLPLKPVSSWRCIDCFKIAVLLCADATFKTTLAVAWLWHGLLT
jgi:hypothetical protein